MGTLYEEIRDRLARAERLQQNQTVAINNHLSRITALEAAKPAEPDTIPVLGTWVADTDLDELRRKSRWYDAIFEHQSTAEADKQQAASIVALTTRAEAAERELADIRTKMAANGVLSFDDFTSLVKKADTLERLKKGEYQVVNGAPAYLTHCGPGAFTLQRERDEARQQAEADAKFSKAAMDERDEAKLQLQELRIATQCRRFSESDCQCAKCYRDGELKMLKSTLEDQRGIIASLDGVKNERDEFKRVYEGKHTEAEDLRERLTVCRTNYKTATARADANQSAAGIVQHVRRFIGNIQGRDVPTEEVIQELAFLEAKTIEWKAAADTLERLNRGCEIERPGYVGMYRLHRADRCFAEVSAERDQYKQSHDTLERMRKGEVVLGERLVSLEHYDTILAHSAKHDALAAQVAEKTAEVERAIANGLVEIRKTTAERDALAARVAEQDAELKSNATLLKMAATESDVSHASRRKWEAEKAELEHRLENAIVAVGKSDKLLQSIWDAAGIQHGDLVERIAYHRRDAAKVADLERQLADLRPGFDRELRSRQCRIDELERRLAITHGAGVCKQVLSDVGVAAGQQPGQDIVAVVAELKRAADTLEGLRMGNAATIGATSMVVVEEGYTERIEAEKAALEQRLAETVRQFHAQASIHAKHWDDLLARLDCSLPEQVWPKLAELKRAAERGRWIIAHLVFVGYSDPGKTINTYSFAVPNMPGRRSTDEVDAAIDAESAARKEAESSRAEQLPHSVVCCVCRRDISAGEPVYSDKKSWTPVCRDCVAKAIVTTVAGKAAEPNPERIAKAQQEAREGKGSTINEILAEREGVETAAKEAAKSTPPKCPRCGYSGTFRKGWVTPEGCRTVEDWGCRSCQYSWNIWPEEQPELPPKPEPRKCPRCGEMEHVSKVGPEFLCVCGYCWTKEADDAEPS